MENFNFSESVAADFRNGRGEVILNDRMSDREIASRIRMAMSISDGAAFTVRPDALHAAAVKPKTSPTGRRRSP